MISYDQMTELADMIAERLRQAQDPNLIVTQAEAANIIGCSIRQLQRMQCNGLKYIPGKPPRFFMQDINDYLKSQRI